MPEHFPDEEIQRVREGTDIVALARQLLPDRPFERAGHQWKTLCPFHEEKTPSFTLTPGKNFAKCFGCDWGGDPIKLYQGVKGCDFPAAMKALGGVAQHHDVPRQSDGGKGKSKGNSKANSKSTTAGTRVPPSAHHSAPEAAPIPPDPGATADPDAPWAVSKQITLETTYHYHRPDGTVAHQKGRFTPKQFRQRRPLRPGERAEWENLHTTDPTFKAPHEVDGWVYSTAGTHLYPYRLPHLIAADRETPVFFTEGEKDADTLAALGLVSTTFTDKEVRPEYLPYLRDRWIVIVEDHDPLDPKTGKRPGTEHATRLGLDLMPHARRLTWLTMPALRGDDCPEKIDITEHVENARATFQSDDDIRRDILDAADAGVPPLPVVYQGYYYETPRGATALMQDVLASRIVQHRRLLYAGSAWWQWRVKGEEEAGTWRRLTQAEQVDDWIRRVLRSEESTLPLVTANTLSSIERVMRSSHYCAPDGFNHHDPYLLNCRSGMLDLRTGDLHPHDPRHRSTTQSPVAWDPSATCPTWEKVLPRIQPDQEQRDLLQEMFGYCLVPAVNYHVFFFLYGDGGTGKSTVSDLLVNLVGEPNTMAIQPEELDDPYLRAELLGKQLYLASELTAKSFRHIGMLKAIVSGDPISAEVKYGPHFKFRPQGRLVMTSNVVAATPDTTGGFERRFLQIDFNQVIPKEERDYQLMDKLRAELPGVLRWAVEGFQRLHTRGRFQLTAAAEKATQELMRHRASVREFLKDTAWVVWHKPTSTAGDGRWVSTKDLFHHYLEWCDFHGVRAYYENDNTFCKEGYNKHPNLKLRRVRRQFGGEREVGFPGIELTCPPEWKPQP